MKQFKIIPLMIVFFFLFGVFSSTVSFAESQTSPVEITRKYYDGLHDIYAIVSIEDSVIIDDIVFNRGNVKLDKLTKKELPYTLQFGEEYITATRKGIKEVQIVTRNHGVWVFKF